MSNRCPRTAMVPAARLASLVVLALALAAFAHPDEGAARVEKARYTLEVRLVATRATISEGGGVRRTDTTRTTLWRGRSPKPLVVENRGATRWPGRGPALDVRFRTPVRGTARSHRVRGWVLYETLLLGPCRIFPRDIGPLTPNRLTLRIATIGRGSTPYRRMAIIVRRADAMARTLFPPTPCPSRVPGQPGWFPGSTIPCESCAVRPISLVYDAPFEAKFGRRRFVLTRSAASEAPGGRSYPQLREERTDAGIVTTRETTLRWVLTFRRKRGR